MQGGPVSISKKEEEIFKSLFIALAKHQTDLPHIQQQLPAEQFKKFVPYAQHMKQSLQTRKVETKKQEIRENIADLSRREQQLRGKIAEYDRGIEEEEGRIQEFRAMKEESRERCVQGLLQHMGGNVRKNGIK